MRWIVYIIAGWVVVSFVIGAIIGHLVTRNPHVQRSDEEAVEAGGEPDTEVRRTRRTA
jgi:hypothetical protein